MDINFAFLDSGTGGLPYLKYLKERKPAANCIYVGDTKNFPYGEKSREEIIEKSCECVKKIIDKWNPNAIVIACNTMSVTALEEMRNRFPFTPFIGTVPAIKPASIISKSRVIGLLATNATVNHPYTKKLISDFASDCKVISRGDPELISFIEHKYYFATEGQRLAAVKPAVDFFKSNGCDAIVLACNTMSVTALEEMRNRFPFTPFIGTVPAIKPASIISKSRVIGLLATNATVNHPYTKKLISDFASDCKVISRGDPELISFIEHKYYFATEEQRLAAVKPAVDFFKSNGCDAIVLACTHFLNMAEEIQMVCGEEIKVVDSRDGVVRHAFDVESEREVIGKKSIDFEKKIKSELYVTGFSEAKDSERYLSFCLQNDLKFGGIL